MTPTREQIDAALSVVASEVEHQESLRGQDRELLGCLRILTSAIPALTADLVAERMRTTSAEDRAKQAEIDRGIAQGLLSDERKAHVGTRRELTFMTDVLASEKSAHQATLKSLDELSLDVGQALCASTLSNGEALKEPREHAIVSTVVDLKKRIHAWQTATGNASPEAYSARVELGNRFDDCAATGNGCVSEETKVGRQCRYCGLSMPKPGAATSRVEPGADVIDGLGRIFWDALNTEDIRQGHLGGVSWDVLKKYYADDSYACQIAGIRAVVAALAEMGAEAMPSEEDVAKEADASARTKLHSVPIRISQYVPAYVDGYASCAFRLAPVLGARRALDAATNRPAKDSTIELALSWLEPFATASPRVGAAVAAIGIIKSYRDLRDAASPTDEQLAEEAARFACAQCEEPFDASFDVAQARSVISGESKRNAGWHQQVRAYAAGARREGLR